jgi:hypothetical protein
MNTFSRPVKSGWKPAPSSSSEATLPPTSRWPLEGRKIPAIRRSSVVLPEPLRPITPTASPGSIENEASRTAQTSVLRRCLRRNTASFSVTCGCG